MQISPSRDAHLEHGCLPSHCNVAGCQLFLAEEKHQYAGWEVQLNLGSLLPALGARSRGHGLEQTPLPR